MLCISWIAITIVAIRSPTIWWASITFSLTLLILGFALIASIFGTAKNRAFRLGFVIFGCGYFALVFAPYLDRQIGHRLISTKVFAAIHPWMHEQQPKKVWYGATSSDIALSDRHYDLILRSASGPAQFAAPQWDPFQQTCHSLITLPIAFLGGICAFFAQRSQDAG